MGTPVSQFNTFRSGSFSPVAENIYDENHKQRRIIELDVIDYSFKLFNEILLPNNYSNIQLLEAVYISACLARQKRLGESIVIGWTACEQLMTLIWTNYLISVKSDGYDSRRITKERFKKLTGRDYSASIIAETLELTGVIANDLYRLLDVARRSRNKWAHELRQPKQAEINCCQQSAEKLMEKVFGFSFLLQYHSGGGGSYIAYTNWKRALQNRNLR